MHRKFWLFMGVGQNTSFYLIYFRTQKLAYFRWLGATENKKGVSNMLLLQSTHSQAYSHQRKRDYKPLKKRNQQIPLTRNLYIQV